MPSVSCYFRFPSLPLYAFTAFSYCLNNEHTKRTGYKWNRRYFREWNARRRQGKVVVPIPSRANVLWVVYSLFSYGSINEEEEVEDLLPCHASVARRWIGTWNIYTTHQHGPIWERHLLWRVANHQPQRNVNWNRRSLASWWWWENRNYEFPELWRNLISECPFHKLVRQNKIIIHKLCSILCNEFIKYLFIMEFAIKRSSTMQSLCITLKNRVWSLTIL